jgi:hypothetical protein
VERSLPDDLTEEDCTAQMHKKIYKFKSEIKVMSMAEAYFMYLW